MGLHWELALIGGAMVGGGGCISLLVNGRILGTSGILGGLVDGSGQSNRTERITFLLGLVGVPGVIAFVLGAPDKQAHSKQGCDNSPILLKSREYGHGPYRAGFA